jgi:uncharacterized protein YehS (DUF1456 family)
MALTNNDIIKKLRVALKLRDVDIIEILALVDYEIGKSELGAFFRNEDHPKYVDLQDQILRNFLNGLIIYKRGTMEERGKTPHVPTKSSEQSDAGIAEKSPRKSSSENSIDSAQNKYGEK